MSLVRAGLVRDAFVLFVMLVAMSAVSAPRLVKADLSSALDGVGHTVACGGSACSQMITTTQNNDVIILIAESQSSSQSVIDSVGLSFVQRLSFASSTNPYLRIWEYYAIAGSPLSNDNVTVVEQSGFPKDGIQVLAVHGATTSQIFDTNPSVPATVSCPGSGCGDCTANFNQGTCSASIDTSSTDFVIATTGINDAGPCGTSSTSSGQPPPGFTSVTVWNGEFEVDYALTSPGSHVVFSCSGTDAVGITLDAISLSGTPDPPSYTLTWQGYDWDGSREETLSLNSQFLASLPANDTPVNGGAWASFSLDITPLVVNGTNVLRFAHAPWDCSVSDDVSNLAVLKGSTVIFTAPSDKALSCSRSATYTFTV